MKYKYIVAPGIIGQALNSVGALFKIQSWPYASECLVLGTLFWLIALFLLFIKIFQEPKLDR
jgi:hypothetical protein